MVRLICGYTLGLLHRLYWLKNALGSLGCLPLVATVDNQHHYSRTLLSAAGQRASKSIQRQVRGGVMRRQQH